MKRQPTVADIVMMAGGAVTFLFSFFSFWDQGGLSENAWGSIAFPLATIPAIITLSRRARQVVTANLAIAATMITAYRYVCR